MKDSNVLTAIQEQLRAGGCIQLFLDYDGTLLPFAPTPSGALPDDALLALLTALTQTSTIRTTILSGRPLAFFRANLSMPGLALAGTYGAEIKLPGKKTILRADLSLLRPTIEQVKAAWSALIAGCTGFVLEDKGLAIALHARFAEPADADSVLPRAREYARQVSSSLHFRILGGDRFLEIAPVAANKGETVKWFMEKESSFNALPVYFGDDDKDEEAFAVIRKRGGVPIIVGPRQTTTSALVRLPSPASVRQWLELWCQTAATIAPQPTLQPGWIQS